MKFLLLIFATTTFASTDIASILSDLPRIAGGPQAEACLPPVNPLEGLVSPGDRNAGRCLDNQNRQPLGVGQYRVMTWQDGRPGYNNRPKRGPRYNENTGQDRFYETGNYLLRRASDSHYQVALNLNITPVITTLPEGKTEADRPQLLADLKNETLAKINDCMATMRPHLRGPGGTTMEIRVLTPEQTNTLPEAMRPLARNIEVSSAHNGRGNADQFGTSFTCPTIGHELLHHLGLCDEYPEVEDDKPDEPGKGKSEEWSCRVTPVATSFMKETFYEFDRIVPQTFTCDCTGNAICLEAMASDSKTKDLFLSKDSEDILEVNFYKKYCEPQPQNTTSETDTIDEGEVAPRSRLGFRSQTEEGTNSRVIFERIYPQGKNAYSKVALNCLCPQSDTYCMNMVQEMRRRIADPPRRTKCPHGTIEQSRTMNTVNGTTGLVENILTIQTQSNNQSLLKPNQFRKILAGDCIGQAPDYEACAQFSNIPRESERCVVPANCLNDNFFHGTSAQ